jgi:hypothetical protein
LGEVKDKLSELVQKFSQVPKKAAFTYTGANIGECIHVLALAVCMPHKPPFWFALTKWVS